MIEVKNIYEFIKENNVTKIFLDIDGVVLHSCQAIVDILNMYNNTNFTGQDVTSWNFKEIDNTLDDEKIEELFNSSMFFVNARFIHYVIGFIKKYKDKIILVTKGSTANYKMKRDLFDLYDMKDIPIIPLPLNISKSIINMKDDKGKTLFIDDSTNNLVESNADIKIQFREYRDNREREWQKDWDSLVMYHWYKTIDF